MAIQQGRKEPKIGPSDTSDSYSDDPEAVTDSDSGATGEDAGAPGRGGVHDETAPDRVVDESEAGLGGGLDEAEEARLGRRDDGPARKPRGSPIKPPRQP
jgi:hypothetical protein